ncbi:TRM13/UPF0224 family, U11-48K-like CHHC zinc finger domain [Cinara cedri]|uniref:TRM13/UPF0224 family, U11-48K-like CHHC zinc finger domain n=1 Tax=Cinara cedri TaxID=506608 RepID=A0A5E4NFU3_9HEMI|nr:TRM13/UPF0224 family, U11-48K-like CHHC zinc finger domain [Cinara cedri]
MAPKKFNLHLLKCPDRKPNFKHCFYNDQHVMHKSELEKHEENCPNRILMDQYLYQSKDAKRPNITVSAEPPSQCDEEESWNQPAANKINVIETIKNVPNFMKPNSEMTRSERKKNKKSNGCNINLAYDQYKTINERLTEAAGSSSKSNVNN